MHDLLGTVQSAISKAEPKDDPAWLAALAEVDAYLDAAGLAGLRRLEGPLPARRRPARAAHRPRNPCR